MAEEGRSVLDIVESIDQKLDKKSIDDEARFLASEALLRDHEHRLDGHDEKLTDHEDRLRSHDTLIRDQGAILVKLGQSTAAAVEYALKAVENSLAAKREVSATKDEALKIVESAIRMHSASICTTVTSAVKQEIGPLVSEVDKLKTSTGEQDKTLAQQDVKLDAILAIAKTTASTLGNKKLRIVLLVCACIGALGGGFYAGYLAKQGSDVVTAKPSPPALSTPPR